MFASPASHAQLDHDGQNGAWGDDPALLRDRAPGAQLSGGHRCRLCDSGVIDARSMHGDPLRAATPPVFDAPSTTG